MRSYTTFQLIIFHFPKHIKIYLTRLNRKKEIVIDVDIPFEKPKNCDLSFNTECKEPEEISDEIIRRLNF